MTIESLPDIRISRRPAPPRCASPPLPAQPPGSPVAAALIAGFAIYVPVPILRGALFGLMPGIAWRSWRLAGQGALSGSLAELIYTFFFLLLLSGWNTRATYCEYLLTHLPPGNTTYAIPDFHALPNSAHFIVNIVTWGAVAFSTWYVVWSGLKLDGRFLAYMGTAIIGLTLTAAWLWKTAPPGPYMRSSISPANEAETLRFLAGNFIFAFSPICALAGLLLAKSTRHLPNSASPAPADVP